MEQYSKPTVFRIKLNYQQAVLAACSVSARTARSSGSRTFCRYATTRCRRGNNANADRSAGS